MNRIGTATIISVTSAKPPRGKRRSAEVEADFQKSVIQFAKMCGWRVAHFRKVRVQRKNGRTYWETPVAADGKGFPDLLLVKGPRLVVLELKVPGNNLTPKQGQWLGAFEAAGATAWCVYPRDWDEIQRLLQGDGPPGPSSTDRTPDSATPVRRDDS